MGQIEDLRLFVLVVENGSISKAANQLHIAKSAVSRRLSLLEGKYGATLINRQPGVWEVTNVGRELYQRAVAVVGDVEEIAADFDQAPRALEGPLTITVPQEFGLMFLSPVLVAFSQRHPDIQLTIDFDNRPVDLTRENYDLAIRVTPHEEHDANAQLIGTSKHCLYSSRAYLQAHGTPVNAQELKDHALLNYGSTKQAQWAFTDENGTLSKIVFKPAMSSNSGVFLADALGQGLGIARLPDFVGRVLVAKGELTEILQDLTQAPLNIYLIHDENRRLNHRMRVFAQEMTLACAASS